MNVQFGVYAPLSPFTRILETANLAEKYGFDSVWMGDHVLLPFSPPDCLEVWTTFGAISMVTRKVKLGIGVTDPIRKHPAVLAQTATTLDIISNGRLIMGIGPGEAMNLDPYGIDWKKPVTRMRETIEVIKKLWCEDKVNYEGQFYKLNNAYLKPKPIQKPHPPIWVAANSERTLKITGEMADGWLPFRTAPETLAKDLGIVKLYAEKAGRSIKEIVVAPHTFVSISRNRDLAREALERVRFYLLLSPKRVEQLGYTVPTHEFDFSRVIYSPDVEKKIMEKMKEVPLEAAEKIVVWGTPDDCIERFEKFIKVGANYFVLMVLQTVGYWGPPEKARREAIKLIGSKVLPYFKDER